MSVNTTLNNLEASKKINSSNNKKSTNKSNKTSNDSYSNYEKSKYTYSDIFAAASKKYNVPQKLLEAVAYTESSFRANATSYCGAQGIMQLMPATAKSLGVNDAYNPIENIMGGAKYLSQMLKKYNGNTSLALAAYNGGPGNVAKHNGVPSFCQGYVNKVQGLIKNGVNVPNKTVTVTNNSTMGKIMSKYNDNTVSTTFINKKVNSAAIAYATATNTTSSATNGETNSTITSAIIAENDISNINSYAELYAYATNKYSLPSGILEAITLVQSNFDSDAKSSSGAIGLMQLMPATSKELGVSNAYNPIENVLGGAKYLSQLLNRYNNNTSYAIAAYTAGMGNVDKYGIPTYAKSFVDKVLTHTKKGVSIPNIDLDNSSFSSKKDNQSNNDTLNEHTNKKKLLIDIQV